MREIHPTAIVSSKADLGSHVKVGPWTIIYDNVRIGDGTDIGANCEIGQPTKLSDGRPLSIGANSLIRSGSVFYEGSTIADGLVTGHKVVVRESCEIGASVQLGSMSDVQGRLSIGDFTRTQSNVFIAQGTTVGRFVWLFPYVVLTNDPHPPSMTELGCRICDYAAIAAASVVLPGVTIGEHSLVAAKSCVNRDVAPHTVVGGAPAKFICETSKVKLRGHPDRPAYPWPAHFHRGYPPEIVNQWKAEYIDV